jgi:hypothetical protein
MKKIIVLIAVALVGANGQSQITNVDTVTPQVYNGVSINGDPLPIAFGKLNWSIDWLATNQPAAGQVTFTNTITLPAGTPAYVTNWGGLVGVFQVAIPAGAAGAPGATGATGATGPAGPAGTNFVTAFAFTNQVLSSFQETLFTTNYVTWSASNYIGTFSQISEYNFVGGSGGGGGMVPSTNVFEQIVGTTNGGANWFVLRSGYSTTNPISIAVVGAGGGLGSLTVYGNSAPYLAGNVIQLYQQEIQISNPQNAADVANKQYVDIVAANTVASQWSSFTDSNGMHYCYQPSGQPLLDLVSTLGWIAINHAALDSTKTNLAFTIYQTNLVAGWQIQSSTNLLLTNGWSAATYSAATNSGTVTFTAPLTKTAPQMWFRAIITPSTTINAYAPINAMGGMNFPSNTWVWATVTNGMGNGDFRVRGSNGVALVSVYMWGGAVTIKQLAP